MKTEWFNATAKGWTKVGPGLYEDPGGDVHILIPELLDHFGYADTPENRETCAKAAIEIAQRQWPSTRVHEVE